MKFDYTFFEDEVREGFYVSGLMKRAWAAQLEVLEEIDKVCKRHNITWYAYAGTLLGAVRHKGYIPWDDDLDIMMFRKDYDRFREFARNELPQGYVVMSMHEEEVSYEFHTRITNSHELSLNKAFTEKHHQCPFVMGVDIFPVDNLAPNEEEEEKRKELAHLCIHAAETITPENKDNEEAKGILCQLEDLCDVSFDDKKPLKQQLYEMTEKIFCLYNEFETPDVAIMCYWTEYHKDRYSLSWFKDVTMLSFETTKLPAPIVYDEVLRSKYGDYMKIVKGGSDHNYPFFRGQEELFKEKVEEYPFEYQFNKADLYCENRLPARRSKTEAEQFMTLMERAHGMMGAMLSGGNAEGCLKLLEACQSRAIYTGTLIEENYGEDSVTVRLLEEYCELLYEIHEMILEEDITQDAVCIIANNLEEILKKLKGSIKQEVLDRREVVFMPFRACYWEQMEPAWREACMEEGCDVYVVPIPYYEKDAIGRETDIHYEGDKLPEYVSVTDYETYDFEGRHPDVIFIQNPYDECNYTISVPPAFFSRNLRRYTEQLVYIPYFVMDEIEDDDERGLSTMRYFCTVPGVVCADKVVVQSEQMRKRYIECLTAFAGADTKQIWENKIFVAEQRLGIR